MRSAIRIGVFGLLALSPLALSRPAAAIERAPEDIPPPAQAAAVAPVVPNFVGPGSRMTFTKACAPGKRITIVGIGDLLFHPQLEQEALTPTGTYRAFWKPVEPVLQAADLTYGNFEGTSAEGITTQLEFVPDPGRNWNNRVYSAPPSQLLFNYHPSVVGDLKASGFDIVSTANTHSLDRGPIGIERTIANLHKGGIAVSGTRMRDATDTPFSVVTTVKGLNIAWLACTYYTNGFIDQHSQVLYCFEQREQVLSEIRRLAASPAIDAVILTPHWGLEGSPTPEQRQRDLARDAIEAGAQAVIGTHPHVLQPWDKMTARDGHEGLVVYSTGNFISAQHRPEQRLGAMVVMELLKEPGAAKARVTAAGYVSSWVETEGPHRVVEAPHTMPSRFLPEGNRVMMADLPKLPRDCGPGEEVAASWGDQPAVTASLLTLPTGANKLAEAGAGATNPGLVQILPQAPAPEVTLAAVPPVPPRLPAIAPLRIERLATVVTAMREEPGGPGWLAVLAEIDKKIPSDAAVRALGAAQPEVASRAKDRPQRKHAALLQSFGSAALLGPSKQH